MEKELIRKYIKQENMLIRFSLTGKELKELIAEKIKKDYYVDVSDAITFTVEEKTMVLVCLNTNRLRPEIKRKLPFRDIVPISILADIFGAKQIAFYVNEYKEEKDFGKSDIALYIFCTDSKELVDFVCTKEV